MQNQVRYFYARNRQKAFQLLKAKSHDGTVWVREINGTTGDCYGSKPYKRFQARFRCFVLRYGGGHFSNLIWEQTR